ncbi:MAG: histidine kinase, partial [Pseudoclavibacter sp.]
MGPNGQPAAATTGADAGVDRTADATQHPDPPRGASSEAQSDPFVTRVLDAVFDRDPARPHWLIWLLASIAATTIISVGVPVHLVTYGVDQLGGAFIASATIASVMQGLTIVLVFVMPRLASVLHVIAVLWLAASFIPLVIAPATGEMPWPLSPVMIVGFVFFLVALAVRVRPQLAIGVTVSTLLPLAGAAIVVAAAGFSPSSAITTLAVAAGLATAVSVGATFASTLIAARREVKVARHETELADERRRSTLERARIAREMHDVVAHSMSI